ncbi:D-arabinitol 4-dehydrogenase [Massilia suwonensis]|uniref:D-arabinitol 4-dehydrogenase n=1 Tax=Massilia suwonensis TaxID=648895 RepID=A0ABW0MP12_9BURK
MHIPDNLILHLGLGAFHRAHQAACLQELIERGQKDWRIVAANIRPDPLDVSAALIEQGCAYTLETISPAGAHAYRRIEAIAQVLPYTSDLAAVIAAGADSRTRIVSFTVTEAGYCLSADGRLDPTLPELQAGLDAAGRNEAGSTIYGVLTAILRARRAAKAGPLTLLCCDNLRHNGERVRAGLAAFLALADDPGLLAWTGEHTRFPNSMVDRITPRAGPEVRTRVLAATGRDDAAAVSSESFLQWVIEDDFCNGRPRWEDAGAELVADVAPYEEAKIRILNASHSCIAWAGALAGYRYIHEGMRDARIRTLVHDYVTHAVFDCLRPSPVDLEAYRDTVIERFAGDAVRDTIDRVLADSLAKLPGFIVPTIRERVACGLPLDAVAVLPALFLAFLCRWQAGLARADYRDAALDAELLRRVCCSRDVVAAFCAEPTIWGDLANSERVTSAVRAAHARALALTYPPV